MPDDIRMSWKDHRLYLGTRLSGYSVVPDEQYPTMWRVKRPDGSLSDMVNLPRAKDAAMAMLGRDLKAPKTGTVASSAA
jgi:hypothetical protein